MVAITAKLLKLASSAQKDGHFALALAASAAAAGPDELDHQLNLVGALHEVHKLPNSLAPYWLAFRRDESAWIERAVVRLRDHDADYWALASLLGSSAKTCFQVLGKQGYAQASLRWSESFKGPKVHTAVWVPAAKLMSDLWAPVFEIGFDPESFVVLDAARLRAVHFSELTRIEGNAVGKGSGSYFMRAGLPHGSWRMVSAAFELNAEHLVPRAKPRGR
jgi:hypothetical protein